MVHAVRSMLVLLILVPLVVVPLVGCAVPPARSGDDLPQHRPSDFTLGLVVFGGEDAASSSADRSARYIVEPGGVFRASFGGGSQALTHPPITRRLDDQQLDGLWDAVRALGLGDDPWTPVPAPEIHHNALGSARGYLLELRSGARFDGWTAPPETGPARSLAEHLAALSWVTD